jgi:RND family efflux transporter MFP subunit
MNLAVPGRTFVVVVAASLCGCGGGSRSSPSAPVAEKPKIESELSFITLSETARKSLAIETKRLAPQSAQEHLLLTGWIMAPAGQEVTMTAPAAGYVRAAGKRFPAPGDAVQTGDKLFAFEPVLTPLEQIQLASLKRGVESELTKAKITIGTARTELERVKELHGQGLRGQQDVDQAKKLFDHAEEDLRAAQDKQKLFDLGQTTISSPRAGKVLTVNVSPGQYVPAAAPLVTVIDLHPVWVRVAVPEFDLPLVDRSQDVAVHLKNHGAKNGWRARYVTHPPQVDAPRHSADLVYELLPGKDKLPEFVKNQAVTVHVPLGRERSTTLVPYAAVVFDGFGGSWIYLDRTADGSSEHRYERRRVETGWSRGGEVTIRPGFAQPEHVVVAGAGVLFSREFHRPPVAGPASPVDDDD